MSTLATSAAERYDTALRTARHGHLPPDYPVPQPTSAWPADNLLVLEQYQDWLLSSGVSAAVTALIHLPMAGHVLGLNLKPHTQLDLDADLNRALAYIQAKQLSPDWTKNCRNALLKFRLFLRQQRSQPNAPFTIRPVDRAYYCAGVPDWLVHHLARYQHLQERHWRPVRLNEQIHHFWSSHTRPWRWLFARHPLNQLTDLKRQDLLDYIDHRLVSGCAVSTINSELRTLQAFLRYLQEQDYLVPQALLRLPGLKQPDRLPRFLTDDQISRLRDEVERRVNQGQTAARRRDALLDRAAFYLMWQGGLRLGEVEDLQLADLDLTGRRLTVRQGKGRKDRTIYLTDRAVEVMQAYLAVRGVGPTDHVFLYRTQPLHKDFIRDRLKACGQQVGVKVSPHRLRHTYATQLLNAGCRVTSLQKLLGHRRLNSTMTYARVHDRTVAEDYYTAMAQVEKQLDLASRLTDGEEDTTSPVNPDERAHLLELVNQLAQPQLDPELRLELVGQMCLVLDHAGNSPDRANSLNGNHRLQEVLVV